MASSPLGILAVQEGVSFRAGQLFRQRLDGEQRATDRVFLVLFLLQWAGAIIVALTYSPRIWSGAYGETYVHLWAAVLLGGAITCLPVILALVNPGAPFTRHMIAAGQMLWSALLIHLCGGRIETHFHVFVSLAFLATYRDWRVLVTATVVIGADHLVRGIYWPQSIYGVLTARPWRVAEHAGWVVFEDIVLLVSMRTGIRESLRLAQQQAVLEQNHNVIEMEVAQRTEQLRNKEEEVFHLQKLEAVGQLAGGIAHEFNNLLQAIRGYTNLAIDGLRLNEPRCQDLQQVLKAADRATVLTRGLLGFARRQEANLVVLDLRESVNDLVLMIRPLLGERIILDVNVKEPVASVQGDSTLLQQMLMNLCVNARDAMPDGGRLCVSTQTITLTESFCTAHAFARPGDYVLLTVSDTGCGMTPEVRERIFEPFYTTKEVGKGTGLGLAMVHGVVQQHSGMLHVYSEPGRGTTFRIYLPAVLATADPVSSEQPQAVCGGTETILIAEDESIVRALTERLLTQVGYKVLSAVDGQSAVELFQDHEDEVSLVLLDVVMPRLNGRNALQRIREIRPDVSAILSSGYDPHMAQEMFHDVEQVSLLEKPFDPHDLLGAVRRELDRRPGGIDLNDRLHEKKKLASHIAATAPNAQVSAQVPIDRAVLLDRCMGNLAFALSLLEELDSTGQQRVDEIARHAAARDAVETAEAAHALKGAVGILAAESVRTLAAKIEAAGNSGELEGIDELVDELRREMTRCLAFVPSICEEAPAT